MTSIPSKFDSSNDIFETFKILSSSPSSVFLSYNSISNEIVPTFYHKLVGNTMIDNSTSASMIGLSGFDDIATPIKFGENIFSSFKTEKAAHPEFFEILEFGKEATNNETGRSSFKRFSILPVPFFEVVVHEDMSPQSVLSRCLLFHEKNESEFKAIFKEKLKLDLIESNLDQPLVEKELEDVLTTEKIDAFHQDAFYDFFLFLWATSQDILTKYFALTITPVLNSPLISTEVQALHALHILSLIHI